MITLDTKRTALLVMDLQSDIVAMCGDGVAPAVERAGALVAAARKAKIPVVYVVVGFRPGYPEVHPNNAAFANVAQTGRMVTTTPGSDIVSAVRPAEGEVVVMKHRVGAFMGTDMDMVLRAKGIETMVLCGIATSGVVLSTVRHGADADYRIVVVEDACFDRDEEVHRVLTTKVFPRQATIASASDVTAAFQTA